MPKIIKPVVYESPSDDFHGGGHMRVSEIAQHLGISPKEIFERLRRYNSSALNDFSRDGNRSDPIFPANRDEPMPEKFPDGFIPEYAWNQITKDR